VDQRLPLGARPPLQGVADSATSAFSRVAPHPSRAQQCRLWAGPRRARANETVATRPGCLPCSDDDTSGSGEHALTSRNVRESRLTPDLQIGGNSWGFEPDTGKRGSS
jgi:hypothetical protein